MSKKKRMANMNKGEDKIKHILAGFFITFGLGLFWFPLIIIGFSLAIAKELYDWKTGMGKAELWDTIYTFIGCGMGVGLLFFLMEHGLYVELCKFMSC